MPTTIRGWQTALEFLPFEKQLPAQRLMRDAIGFAREGVSISSSQVTNSAQKLKELSSVVGFADTYLDQSNVPDVMSIFKNAALADTLETLANKGWGEFYEGAIAHSHASFLERVGSPLRLNDFSASIASVVIPLNCELSSGTVYNMPPPTQGVSSLLILALFERLGVVTPESFSHVHGLVEATKQAFMLRNAFLGDPDYMTTPVSNWLEEGVITELTNAIDRNRALSWPKPSMPGDTIWMGCMDRHGTVVSFIQSIFWEFGSGVVCPDTGVLFQNRGSSFTISEGPNQLAPGRPPFHTLNPAMAHLSDGKWIGYGTMGGEGQPQIQGAIYSRYAMLGTSLQEAISAPRWLLGRTWGPTMTYLGANNLQL